MGKRLSILLFNLIDSIIIKVLIFHVRLQFTHRQLKRIQEVAWLLAFATDTKAREGGQRKAVMGCWRCGFFEEGSALTFDFEHKTKLLQEA